MDSVVNAEMAFSGADLEARAARLMSKGIGLGKKPDAQMSRYLDQIAEDVIPEDLNGIDLDDLAAFSVQLWNFGEQREKGATLSRLEPGRRADGSYSGRDILEVITADKPFLVDTIMGEVNAQGGEVLAMFHPLAIVERDAKGKRVKNGEVVTESMMQVHIARCPEEKRAAILNEVRAALADLEMAVADFADMRSRMDQVIDDLKMARTSASGEERDEAVAFLRWLRSDHFAFLGCRAYEFPVSEEGDYPQREPNVLPDSSRGVLRDSDRYVLRNANEPAIITPRIADFLREPTPIIVAKSNLQSRVHRRVAMDYIGVKRYRSDGMVIGETRFVGLFTSEAYLAPTDEIPLIRRKVRRVMDRADKAPGSHNQKRLEFILETYPRDELFQSDEDALFRISMGMLHLFDRPRPRLFIRRDRYDRYVSAFAFVPRERFNSTVREEIGDMLASAYGGEIQSFIPSFGDGPLTRVHFIIGTDRSQKPPSVDQLENRLAAYARTWEDEFERQVRAYNADTLWPMIRSFRGAFSAGYQELYSPDEARTDALIIEDLCATQDEDVLAVRAYEDASLPSGRIKLKLYQRGARAHLSELTELLERLGFGVVSETGFNVNRSVQSDADERARLGLVSIRDFEVELPENATSFETIKPAIEDAIKAIWRGDNENDRFNSLVTILGLPWRDVCFLRACARFRQQTGQDPSQGVQEQALADNPEIVRLILDLRDARFSPEFLGDREQEQSQIQEKIAAKLDDVASLDADRVLRRIANLVAATQRTNFYQHDDDGRAKSRIAMKIASSELQYIPEPKPYREIFVWAPHVEGVHIRFGPVARGGLRWSDRRDDFRKEVLDLVKAQQIKNAVIVPVGSKGGFFPKALPRGGSREEVQAEAIRAYKTFISGLLDVTDNLVDNAVKRPERVVAWDGDDPYLVVAADKGTATFSDIANGLSLERGFWLGDAFASGGSAGYDHKKMGITARGAWVAVQRHFRELGKDIQNEPFTVIGVGDMSGDVFGNGMLLSKQIRLLAAFDHRDIFIDPDPQDLEACWNERKRLFEMDRSTWADYDTSLISQGGGIFSRNLKSIPLSAEMRALTGLKQDSAAPFELISALLAADIELLWFGGIGTYIKAPGETDDRVGDRANDPLRITAKQVRAKVIGEGANLGATQAGRIAMARNGVKLNADFVDNSAGVDTSDHEVNIKILLNGVMRADRMTLERRNTLLSAMTDDVANHVLRHNYDQTLAISLAESGAAEDLDAHERLIGRLESRGELNRSVEGLPSPEEFRELKDLGLGLTRPEIGLLIGHAKIAVFNRILESATPDDPHFHSMLVNYFPDELHQFVQEIRGHRLSREIIATVLSNDLVNLGGPTFVHRARESTGGDTDAVARAFEAARHIFRLSDLINEIHLLDNVAPASVQVDLYEEVISILRRQTYWLVRRSGAFRNAKPNSLNEIICAYQPAVDTLREKATEIVSPFEQRRISERMRDFVKAGAPEDIAQRVGVLRALVSSSDVIDMADSRKWPLDSAARLYHAMGDRYRFDRLRAASSTLSSPEHWDRLAVRRLIEDFYAQQYAIVGMAMDMAERPPRENEDAEAFVDDTLERFSKHYAEDAERFLDFLTEIEAGESWTLSKLTIVVTALREFSDVEAPEWRPKR